MLQLQRASAGSGKTYTLTKIYIRNFLAKKVNNRYRLRTEPEMRAVHGRILAITFTNKATNEMKQRIVTALANLAGLYSQDDEKIDYCKEMIKNVFSLCICPLHIVSVYSFQYLIISAGFSGAQQLMHSFNPYFELLPLKLIEMNPIR